MARRNCVQTLEGVGMGHESTVWSLCFNHEGTLLASASADCTAKVWSCESQDGRPFYKLKHTIRGHHRRAVFSVSWSCAGCLATGSGACWCSPRGPSQAPAPRVRAAVSRTTGFP